ncbi:ABC transporter permease [Roseomonas sp. CCTCC AB2023176]|uniref:ABC transporter permease n=1 Tax=Roseomonas sp. CCTCC AB2023176 TaxID=3342640 RepID=UPI0035E222BF
MSDAALPIPPAGPAGGATGQARGVGGFLGVRTRVIHALILREMQTRFGRHNLGFAWLFFEPLFLGVMVGLMHSVTDKGVIGGVDPFYFSVMGYVPFFMFRTIVGRSAAALHANLTLLFHRQVTPLDIVLARNILEGVAVLGVVLLIIAVASWVTESLPHDPSLVVVALLMSFLLANGLSMCVAGLTARWEGLERLVHPITYLMLPISGAFFAVAQMPPEWRELLVWSPLVHPHEAIREGIFGPRIPSYADFGYLSLWILGTNLLGVAALRGARRKLTIF